ncbi:helix-turn-helix domain-containing protein [Paenibacillus agaridevorans]|uniref:helix-turn-helix domain-containing protein n=1 Tax=Paenibacillus agaridevorans TaxID=171404 RepID=UPI001BE431A0|nr:helix-turn-helix domain-containing protein [Paenibacillus agaridevorans]
MKIYYRWLLYYIPVFLAIVSILIFLFFSAMSNYSKQQAIKANQVFAENALQTIDSLLKFTEQMIIKEVLTNEMIRLFYDGNKESDPYEDYQITQRLSDMSTYLLSVDSIYLYRSSDQVILTPGTMLPLNQFADRAFVQQSLMDNYSRTWTDPRVFKVFQDGNNPRNQVISLSRGVPLNTGSQGLIITNVRISKLEEAIRELLDSELNFLILSDANDIPIIGRGESSDQILTKLTSDYTGWTVRSGYKQTNSYGFFASLSSAWYAAILLSVVAGIVWLIVAARKQYRPIQLIESSIRHYTDRSSKANLSGKRQDEFLFIRTAIDELVAHSVDYDKKIEESEIIRKKWLFTKIIKDADPHFAVEWEQELNRLGLSNGSCGVVVVVLEIDRIADFTSAYSLKDQSLLKFAVTAVVRETGQQLKNHTWCEWMSQDQLGVILITERNEESEDNQWIQTFCQQIRLWIEQHLPFTVSCGIGSVIDSFQYLSTSYSEALEALQYKSRFGSNSIVSHEDVIDMPQGHVLQNMDQIRSASQAFRAGDASWEEQVHELFLTLKATAFRREDVIDCINYFIIALDKVCKTLPPGLRVIWEQNYLPEIRNNTKGFIQIEEAEQSILTTLRILAEQLQVQKQKKVNHQLIMQIKEYIETNYDNPDLSLNHISDTFQLHMKSVSRLFKEEFGENFVNYLSKVRMEHAKRLLMEEASEPVQDIARKVGYSHSITFIRVFKKWTGITPGDFRKMNRDSSNFH